MVLLELFFFSFFGPFSLPVSSCLLCSSGSVGSRSDREGAGSPIVLKVHDFLGTAARVCMSDDGEVSQAPGPLVILKPVSVTWGNRVIRLPWPESWTSGRGIIGPSPSEQHRANSK